MKIEKETFVSMEYKLSLESGEVVDQSVPEKPIEFITGYSQIIPGLEKGLIGRAENDTFQVVVEPEDGYGEPQAELVQKVPMDQFPNAADLEVGMTFQAKSPQGMPVNFVVKEIEKETAVIDLNHPLAGKTLVFDIVVKSVREATKEEIDALNSPSCNPDDSSNCGGGCSCG